LRIALNVRCLYAGTHLSLPGVHHRLTERIHIGPAGALRPVPVELDGEVVGCLPATFAVLPSAIDVFVARV